MVANHLSSISFELGGVLTVSKMINTVFRLFLCRGRLLLLLSSHHEQSGYFEQLGVPLHDQVHLVGDKSEIFHLELISHFRGKKWVIHQISVDLEPFFE